MRQSDNVRVALKLFCMLLLLVPVGLSLAACDEKPRGHYASKEKQFSIDYPDNWEIKENELGLAVIGLSPNETGLDDFRENVSVAASVMEKPLTADQVLDANLKPMMDIVSDFKPQKRGTVELNGVEAAWLTYTQKQGKYRLAVKLYAVPGKDYAYLIHCTAETTKVKHYYKLFDQIVKSFKVE